MEFVKVGDGETTSPAGGTQRFQKITDPEAIVRFDRAGTDSGARESEPVISSPADDVGIGGSFVAGFTSDLEEKTRFAASRLFPNVPISESVKRFGLVDGQVVYRGDDGKLYNAFPETGVRGVGAGIAYQGGSLIPLTAGTTTGIVTAPMTLTGPGGLAASMGLTGGAAAAGETVRQKLGDLMLGEASTNDLSLGPIANEAGTNMFGQGIGAGINTLMTRNAVRDVAKLNTAKTGQAFEEGRRAGVDLTLAEATGLPSLAGQQKHLSKITDTSDVMQAFYDKRDRQVISSFQRFLDGVSKAADAEDVGLLAKNAAKGVLDDIKQQTLTAARPLYEAAYNAGDRILISTELERLTGSRAVQEAMRTAVKNWQDEAIVDGFGAMNPGINTAGGTFKIKSGGIPAVPNLQFWDYTKRALDRQADAIADKMPGRARILSKLSEKLRVELDNLVPGEYAAARRTYGTGAENLATSMESALGVVAGSKDRNVMAAARHLFNPSTRSPKMVVKLRKAISAKDPEAWQAVKRLYIQDIFSGAMKATEKGVVANPAGKIFKAFSDPKLRGNLYAAMTRREIVAFEMLQRVYKRAGSVIDTNSDTAFKQLAAVEARNSARPWYAKFARNLNPGQALRSFDEWVTDRNLSRNAAAMADIITTADPKTIEALKELRQLSPKDIRFNLIVGHLMAKTGRYGLGTLLPGPNKEVAQVPNEGTPNDRHDRRNQRLPAAEF